jgi:hypothetical protein
VKKLFFILIVVLPFSVLAQSLTISAYIRDRETSEPLGFASVGIKGQPIGTISNADGAFDFHFPLDLRNEILVISMIGYKNFEAPVWSLIDNRDQILYLDKSPIILEEIVVTDTIKGGDVLRLALSRIEENYPMKPFLLDGFYRDVKKVGGTYISLLEAAVKIFDDDYSEPRNKNRLRERVRLIEVRQSLGYESKFTSYFDQANLLEDLLLENSIRYRHIESDEEFFETLGRGKNSFFDGHEIYTVINADSSLMIYVDKVDFAIIHLEYQTNNPPAEIQKRKNLISKYLGSRKKLDFQRINGKMYPRFFEMTTSINWFDAETGVLKFETELFQQLLINKVTEDVDDKINSTARMRNYGLQYQDQPYNKQFWDNYNVIKDTPLDKRVLNDLEKVAPLEKQFADY